jgi:hypothetical protein
MKAFSANGEILTFVRNMVKRNPDNRGLQSMIPRYCQTAHEVACDAYKQTYETADIKGINREAGYMLLYYKFYIQITNYLE